VRHVGLSSPDFLKPRLRAFRSTRVFTRQWSRQRAPEEIRRGGDVAMCREFIAKLAHVSVDAHNGGSKHDCGSFIVTLRESQVAIEFAMLPRADSDIRAWHRGTSVRPEEH